MIKIPQVTLVAYGSHHYIEAQQNALDLSSRYIQWGAVKNVLDDDCTNIDEWNKAIIYKLPKHIQTKFALLIHPDGYVINHDMWTNRWLKYDYIGAPWPMPKDNYSYRDEEGNLVRVGNSVSLRSKKLMDLIAQREWKSYYGNTNEDGFICCHNRRWLESKGCKFAPLEVAKYFSKEHEIEENKNIKTFCFHQI